MSKQSLESPHVFIYLDKDGIESLYAQTVDRLEIEFTRSQEKEKGGKLGARIGIGGLLGTLLGLTEIGANTELSIGGKHTEEAKMHMTAEHKLSASIDYLTNLSGDEYFEDLTKAAIHCTEARKSIFIDLSQKFSLPQFYLYPDGAAQVNTVKSVDFEIGPSRKDPHDYSDDYYKRKQYRFFMSASLSKFTRSKDFMPYTGHDAVIFRAYGGENIPLGVFGYLRHLIELEYQIKPYAIWLL